MLFMIAFTYPSANRNEVVKRRLEKGVQVPEGFKLLGEWSYVGSGRVFRLIDVADEAILFKAMYAWSDLGTIETYPVIETEKVMAMLSAK